MFNGALVRAIATALEFFYSRPYKNLLDKGNNCGIMNAPSGEVPSNA